MADEATTGRVVSGAGAERQRFTCPEQSERLERALAHRATVDADYRRHAIDQGCARVEKLEREIVTPAMHRIEAEDPERTLIGLEHRLKGKERLTEKVTQAMDKRGRTAEQAFSTVKGRDPVHLRVSGRQIRAWCARRCGKDQGRGL